MIMKYFFLAAGILFFIAISCDDHSANPPGSNEVMPLKIGNAWNFRVITFYTSYTDTTFYSLRITGDTTIDSKKHYLVSFGSTTMIMINKYDGLYIRSSDGADEKIFHYPAKVGDKFYNNKHDTCEVVSLSEKVIGPTGSFNCIFYESFYITSNTYINCKTYVHPGIGLVLFKAFKKDYGKIVEDFREELMSYTIK